MLVDGHKVDAVLFRFLGTYVLVRYQNEGGWQERRVPAEAVQRNVTEGQSGTRRG